MLIDTRTGRQVGVGNPLPGTSDSDAPGVGGGSLTPDAYNQIITDASSFSLTLDSGNRNAIQWIAAKTHVLIGTTGGEWRLSGHSNKPFTPTNYDLKQQTFHGSKDLQSIRITDAIAFVNTVGRKLYKLQYNGVSENYDAPDLAILAEHISKTGITTMAFQRNPDDILWVTLTDGTLISMTYDPGQNVIAWARHPMPLGGEADAATADSGYSTAPEYPTLQELTAAEIPDKPTELADISLSSPVEITLPETIGAVFGLDEIANDVTGHYVLRNDIDMVGVTWTPIVNFTGVFDGGGYTIFNLTVTAAGSDNQGMFGTVGTGAQIRDVNFRDASITGKDHVAVLVGNTSGVDNVKISDVNFVNCYVSGDDDLGFVLGKGLNVQGWQFWRLSISGNSSIDSTGVDVGGIVGDLDHDGVAAINMIVDCSNTSTGTLQGDNCGGIAGAIRGGAVASSMKTEVHTCMSSCEISRESTNDVGAGGFVYTTTLANYTSCYATGDITSLAAATDPVQVGGFVGLDVEDANYIDCYATGNITAYGSATKVGGFCGKGDFRRATVLRCYATGNIDVINSSTYEDIGGFSGSVEGGSDVGISRATFDRCWATGDITFSLGDTGGLAGSFIGGIVEIGPAVTDCYAWGSITAANNAVSEGFGGFIGGLTDRLGKPVLADVNMINCYDAQTDTAVGSGYTNQITASDNSGGFVGLLDAGIYTIVGTDTYWDTQTSGLTIAGTPEADTEDVASGQLTEWLQTKTNFTAYDFDTIWYMPTPVFWINAANSNGLGANSVAVIPSTTEDEVWVSVGRVIDGDLVRTIERMTPRDWGDDMEDMFFIDSGLTYDSTPTTTLTGLDHLEGETVAILGDGAVMSTAVVSGGSVTLAESVSVAQVGLPYTYKLKPMRMDQNTRQGTSKGSIAKFAEVVISFYKTLDAKFGDGNTTFKEPWRESSDVYGDPPALFTGDKVVNADGGFSVEDPFQIEGDDPMPCNVRAIIPRKEVTGR